MRPSHWHCGSSCVELWRVILSVPFLFRFARDADSPTRLDQSMIFVIDITKCRDLPVALCNAPNVV